MPFWKISLFVLIAAAIILLLVSMWKVYRKLGKPGWAALVPVYNTVILLEVINRPMWWIALLFIPMLDLIFSFIIIAELLRGFGKGTLFAVGAMLLPFIFWPIIAFGSAEYHGYHDYSPEPVV